MKVAIKNGYRLFYTAWIYSNYKAFNQLLKDLKKEFNGEVKREDLFLVTKLWNSHHSPDMVRQEVNETLKNMGVDYIDLYLIHWPMGYKVSHFTQLMNNIDLFNKIDIGNSK